MVRGERSPNLNPPFIDTSANYGNGSLHAGRIYDNQSEDFWISFPLADSRTQFMAGFVSGAADTSQLHIWYEFEDPGVWDLGSRYALLRITRYDRMRRTVSGEFAARIGARLTFFVTWWEDEITVSGSFTDIPFR